MIVTTEKVKTQATCDCAWGKNDFPNPAAFLVKHTNSKMYSIMCEPHKKGFEEIYPRAAVEYHEWTRELNDKFAEEATAANGGNKSGN